MEPVAATDMQRFFWMLYEASTSARPPLHGSQVSILLGPLDLDALGKSVTAVCEAHDALRTSFRVEDGVLVQTFDAPLPKIDIVDLRSVPLADRYTTAARRITEIVDERFDIEDGTPPVRFALVRLDDDEAAFVRVIHHTITDLSSSQLISEAIWSAYRDLTESRPLSVAGSSFAEYACYERDLRLHPEADAKRAFWKTCFDGITIEARRARTSARVVVEIPGFDLQVARAADRYGVSRSAVVLARLGRVLRSWREGPQAVGYFTANRRDRRFERTVGCLAQWVPIRVDVGAGDMASDTRECQRSFAAAFANLLPIGEISRAVGRPRLFDIVVSMYLLPSVRDQNLAPSSGRSFELARLLAPDATALFDRFRIGSLEGVHLSLPMRSAGQAMGLVVMPTRLTCEYDEGALQREDVERMISKMADSCAHEVEHGV